MNRTRAERRAERERVITMRRSILTRVWGLSPETARAIVRSKFNLCCSCGMCRANRTKYNRAAMKREE